MSSSQDVSSTADQVQARRDSYERSAIRNPAEQAWLDGLNRAETARRAIVPILDEFPADQRAVLVDRLGMETIHELEAAAGNDVRAIPPMAKGDLMRGRPRTSYPVTRFYWACLRAMGPLDETPPYRAIPAPPLAWLEILHVRDSEAEPTFSHPMIAKAIAFFGGWNAMWKEFVKVNEGTARYRFITAYKELTGSND